MMFLLSEGKKNFTKYVTKKFKVFQNKQRNIIKWNGWNGWNVWNTKHWNEISRERKWKKLTEIE